MSDARRILDRGRVEVYEARRVKSDLIWIGRCGYSLLDSLDRDCVSLALASHSNHPVERVGDGKGI
jgi:hypothetical protein